MKLELKNRLPFTSEEQADSFELVVRNTTNSTIYANILGSTTNLKDNANATISYTYNLAGETFTSNSITIQYRAVTEPNFQTATLALNQQNIEGVVFALNQLGIGTWFYSGTDVITYNNNYIFGTLGVSPTTTIAGQINLVFTTNGGTQFNSVNQALAIQSDGKIIVGGAGFTSYDGNPCNFICRLNSDGTFDNTFNIGAGFDGLVAVILVQTDGKIIVGGGFSSFNFNNSDNICRLNADGTLDNTFIVGSGFFSGGTIFVADISLQSDGKIIVVGNFINYNANPCAGICRLNPDGTFDNTFNIGTAFGFSGTGINSAIQSDGKIIVVGAFNNYNGNPCNLICRINPDGTFDNTFNIGTGFDSFPQQIQIQSDGKIVCVGSFTNYDGNTCNSICRLNTDGTFDNTFNIGTAFIGGGLESLTIQQNGKIIVSGNFTTYNGNPCNNICRLNTDGTFDNTFVMGTGFDAPAFALLYNNDKVTCGGNFTTYNGTPTNYIAQLFTVFPA